MAKGRKRRKKKGILLKVLMTALAFGLMTALVIMGVSVIGRGGKLKTGSSYAGADNSVSEGTETVSAVLSGQEGTVSAAESAGGEASTAESAGTEASTAESAGTEASAAESTGAQASTAESAGTEASTAESSGAQAPAAESSGAQASAAEVVSSEPAPAESAEVVSEEDEIFSVPETPEGGSMPEIVTTTPDNSAELAASRTEDSFWEGCPERNVMLLTPNPYSRPQTMRKQVNTIVIHYVALPGSTARGNWDYFESLKTGHGTSAGTHFIIGLEGEIIQCIPLTEVAYATSRRNDDTISIECCHPEEDGKFNDQTYASLIDLTAFLCKALHIKPEEVIRHYDVWGKNCPKYYVEHPKAWQKMKADIRARYDEIA